MVHSPWWGAGRSGVGKTIAFCHTKESPHSFPQTFCSGRRIGTSGEIASHLGDQRNRLSQKKGPFSFAPCIWTFLLLQSFQNLHFPVVEKDLTGQLGNWTTEQDQQLDTPGQDDVLRIPMK